MNATTSTATAVLDAPPPMPVSARPNGGAVAQAAFAAVAAMPAAAAAALLPSHEQAKLNEMHDLAVDIKKDDLTIDAIKNDLKSARGRREQKVQRLMQLSLETTLPLRMEKPREPDLYDSPAWAKDLPAKQVQAVQGHVNEMRVKGGDPLRLFLSKNGELLLICTDPQNQPQYDVFKPDGTGKTVSASFMDQRTAAETTHKIYDWTDEKPAAVTGEAKIATAAPQLPAECRAVTEEQMQLAEVALEFAGETDNEHESGGNMGTFEMDGRRWMPTSESHRDVPGSQLVLPALNNKEYRKLGATRPNDEARNGVWFGAKKTDQDGKTVYYGPLDQGVYLVAPDVLEAWREQQRSEAGGIVAEADQQLDDVRKDVNAAARDYTAKELGLTYDELHSADVSKRWSGQVDKGDPVKALSVVVGVDPHIVIGRTPGQHHDQFTLLPIHHASDFKAAKIKPAKDVLKGKPVEPDELVGMLIQINGEDYVCGNADGLTFVTAEKPVKKQRGRQPLPS